MPGPTTSMFAIRLLGAAFAVAGLATLASAQAGARAPAAPPGEVVARIGDRTISMREVEQFWRESDPVSFARVQQQLYEARKRALDGVIAEYLLGREAARRGRTVEELLAEAVPAGTPAVTDAEVRQAYDQSSAAARGLTLEQARPVILAYLQQQKAREARQQLVDRLRNAAAPDILIALEPPRQAVPVAGTDPVRGAPAAPVAIVAFSDFECPFCRRAVPVLQRLLETYREQVKLVWKDFPLPSHPMAALAAEAARCAQDQGKFWEYHDRLFAEADTLEPGRLRVLAAELGLELKAFDDCVYSRRHRERVAAGLQEGRRLGVEATPTVFINGRRITGLAPFETYERVLLDELAGGRGSARQ